MLIPLTLVVASLLSGNGKKLHNSTNNDWLPIHDLVCTISSSDASHVWGTFFIGNSLKNAGEFTSFKNYVDAGNLDAYFATFHDEVFSPIPDSGNGDTQWTPVSSIVLTGYDTALDSGAQGSMVHFVATLTSPADTTQNNCIAIFLNGKANEDEKGAKVVKKEWSMVAGFCNSGHTLVGLERTLTSLTSGHGRSTEQTALWRRQRDAVRHLLRHRIPESVGFADLQEYHSDSVVPITLVRPWVPRRAGFSQQFWVNADKRDSSRPPFFVTTTLTTGSGSLLGANHWSPAPGTTTLSAGTDDREWVVSDSSNTTVTYLLVYGFSDTATQETSDNEWSGVVRAVGA